MNFWITTDTHLGHENIKKYCGRPDDFEEQIIRNLNPTHDEGTVQAIQ